MLHYSLAEIVQEHPQLSMHLPAPAPLAQAPASTPPRNPLPQSLLVLARQGRRTQLLTRCVCLSYFCLLFLLVGSCSIFSMQSPRRRPDKYDFFVVQKKASKAGGIMRGFLGGRWAAPPAVTTATSASSVSGAPALPATGAILILSFLCNYRMHCFFQSSNL